MTQFSETDSAQRRAEINNILDKCLEWFEARYDIISFFGFRPGSKRVYLGDKAKKLCRYCGRTSPEVKFRNLAHAIPDQVGNNWLFDYEECDTCNADFAKRIENDFGKWTLPWRSLGLIKGKGGVPSIESNDKKFESARNH